MKIDFCVFIKYFGTYVLIIFLFSNCNITNFKSQPQTNYLLDFAPVKIVVIDNGHSGIGPCEPTISIDPSNTKRLVAGSVLNNVYYSYDNGITWTVDKLVSPYGVYGDPVVRYLPNGDVVYAHLSNPSGKAFQSEDFLDRIVVQKKSNGQAIWNNGTYPAVDHTKDHDKQWLSVTYDGDLLMSWTEFDKYGSEDTLSHRSRILFSQSNDNAETWSDPVVISNYEGNCLDDDFTTEGAHPVKALDGSILVVWSFANKLYINKSKDGGNSWLDKELSIADQVGGWSYSIPGLGRCNGFPTLMCDYSRGLNRGNLYLVWTDQRNGASDTDVWCMVSRDNGDTWDAPIRVNDDAKGSHQFMSWMDIDQKTGIIYIVFYDRRFHSDNKTDVFLAYSLDGGMTFTNKLLTSEPFEMKENVFFGDYNDISAHDNTIRPIFTVQNDKKLSVQVAIIDVKGKVRKR